MTKEEMKEYLEWWKSGRPLKGQYDERQIADWLAEFCQIELSKFSGPLDQQLPKGIV